RSRHSDRAWKCRGRSYLLKLLYEVRRLHMEKEESSPSHREFFGFCKVFQSRRTKYSEKLVCRQLAGNADFQVVAGERRRPFAGLCGVGMAKREHGQYPAALSALKFGGFPFAERAKLPGAALDDVRSDVTGQIGGARAWTDRIR